MPKGRVGQPDERIRALALRQRGFSITAIANQLSRHPNTIANWMREAGERGARVPTKLAAGAKGISPRPLGREQLSPVALRALDDFELFRKRYLGHVSTPWQIETAEKVVEWLDTPTKEYVVENMPPGVGKTTLAHDVAAWVTVRNRRVRGLFGSRVSTNATRSCRRLRRTLERTAPLRAQEDHIAKGMAVDAEACLSADYGLFRPAGTFAGQGSDLWRAEEFIVVQFDDEPIEEKEPTWSSYGMDSGVLGNRFDLIIWDDVVDKATIRTADAIDNQREWWDTEGETRLEPGGLLWLIGQRMASSDLYRYCLDKRLVSDDEDTEEGVDPKAGDQPLKYRHIVYRAHDEPLCTGKHVALEPWPKSCLLDPKRLPWRELRAQMANSTQFAVLYQQEDSDPQDVLVPKVWVHGGRDPQTGELFVGCKDEDRSLLELPHNVSNPRYSIATVDPSGTNYWAIQWWVFTPNSGHQVFLMDLVRQKMPANMLLDWNNNTGAFYGIMDEWQRRSVDLGLPITHWVIEVNAAQRYLLTFDHVRRWSAEWKVHLVPHSTTVKKLDPGLGPTIIRDHFRFGRVRLPMKGAQSRLASLKLIEEVTTWPHGRQDDEVMACWFLFAHLPKIATPPPTLRRESRPSWMLEGVA